MSAQIITKEGLPEYAVIPYEEYQRLLAMAEDIEDLADAKSAQLEIETGDDESIPSEIVKRLLAGNEHPLKIWREYRALTQENLGNAVGVGKSYISQIEAGHKTASVNVLNALATALQIEPGSLL
jgi:DNA-binding XRE family transcriptional regulator